ncbi:MAG: methyltransferase domain-containing protein [Pseudomonadota bacterium]
MTIDEKRAYFDGIADRWDGWEDLDEVHGKLASGLAGMGVRPGETVADVGCGTGNLTRTLLGRLSSAGRVVAADLSSRMLQIAKSKNRDPRVEWVGADAHHLPIQDGCVDRVICYSVWPHFDRPAAVALELLRALKPGSMLHVWHLASRQEINAIHASAGEAVRGDVLVEGAGLGRLLEEQGFIVTRVIDNRQHYMVSAVKPGP